MGGDGDRRGGAGPRAIAATLPRVTRASLGRRGFADAAMIAQWPAVIGEALARRTAPVRIAFPPGRRDGGTLHLRAESGAMALELQHLEPVLIERVNAFFGYRAVIRMAITQGPLPRLPGRRPAPRPAPLVDPATVEAELGGIEDPELRRALAGLGARLGVKKDGSGG